MTHGIIFRGYHIDYAHFCWVVSKNGKELHRTDNAYAARKWVNAERDKEIGEERTRRGGKLNRSVP